MLTADTKQALVLTVAYLLFVVLVWVLVLSCVSLDIAFDRWLLAACAGIMRMIQLLRWKLPRRPWKQRKRYHLAWLLLFVIMPRLWFVFWLSVPTYPCWPEYKLWQKQVFVILKFWAVLSRCKVCCFKWVKANGL